MKSVAIYCVCYNSYSELNGFLHSVDQAAEKVKDQLSVTVFVADNSEEVKEIVQPATGSLKLVHFPTGHNAGYLGAVQECMKQYSPQEYDFVIISNVDLIIDSEAFVHLLELKDVDQVGWYAPQIYSTAEKRDLNPAVLSRHAKSKLKMLHFMFNHSLLTRLYEKTLYKRKKLKKTIHPNGKDIYAGHGSFMIFTHAFFQAIGQLNFPIFLYCEEIYLAELCHRNGLQVRYVSSIRATDAEHCSTGKIKSRYICKYKAKALRYILDTYYQ